MEFASTLVHFFRTAFNSFHHSLSCIEVSVSTILHIRLEKQNGMFFNPIPSGLFLFSWFFGIFLARQAISVKPAKLTWKLEAWSKRSPDPYAHENSFCIIKIVSPSIFITFLWLKMFRTWKKVFFPKINIMTLFDHNSKWQFITRKLLCQNSRA